MHFQVVIRFCFDRPLCGEDQFATHRPALGTMTGDNLPVSSTLFNLLHFTDQLVFAFYLKIFTR